MADAERIDKILWAIRVFKTRTEATDACKGGKVKIEGVAAKPSRMVKVGETVMVRKGAVQYTYRIKQLVGNRLGAKLVPDFAENLTPQTELDKLNAPVETFFIKRDRGAGRPTKKDRRSMSEVFDSFDPDAVADFDVETDLDPAEDLDD